jgi:RHS repeat-associated protein
MGNFLQTLGRKFSSNRNADSAARKRALLSRQLTFETLEDRQVMTVDVGVILSGYSIEPSYPEKNDPYGGNFQIYAHFSGTNSATVGFTISGSAKLGIDYELDPDNTWGNVTMSGNGGTIDLDSNGPYWTSVGFDIILLSDDIFEWPEDIVVTITSVTTSDTYNIEVPSGSMFIVDEGDDPFEEITDPGITCTECETGLGSNASGSSAPANPKSTLEGGVSANNGSVRANNDLSSSNGSGSDYGTSLTWSNSGATLAGSFGIGMSNAYQPRIAVNTSNDDVLVSFGAAKIFFYKDGSDYVPYHSGASSLSYDSGDHQYTYVDTTGTTFVFYDDADDISDLVGMPSTAIEALKGQILSITDSFGNITTFQYDIDEVDPEESTGRLLSVERESNSIVETWNYTYVTSGGNGGLVSAIEYQIDAVAVRTSQFDYYSDTHDLITDDYLTMDRFLRSTVVREGDVMGNIIDATYYRYYGENETDGYIGGLKLLLRTEAIQRAGVALTTNLEDMDEVADEDLLDYADLHYKYDGQKRVTEVTALGEGCTICSASGEGTYTYSYSADSGNSDGYNSWKRKTVETLPDGTQRIYYLNYAGQKMLDITKVDSDEWITYYRYDSQGRLILQANPSAVTDYDEGYEELIDDDGGNLEFLADSTGLITTYSYGSSTTANSTTAGNALGYLSGMAIKQGETGTSIPQSAIQYYAHESEVDGTFVYPVATQTVYRNDNGTGGQTTTYAYTWREDGGDETNQILATNVTSAFVSSGQNGSNTTESSITVNDEYGRPVWQKDAAGFISYIEYDNATGAVLKSIRDVDTSETGDFANLPYGWSTSSDSLHLITTYEVDSLGRTIKMVDPKGLISYTVYNDAAHEIRTYRGWDAVNHRTELPVELTRSELIGTYTHNSTTYYGTFTEYLTYSVFGSLEVDGSGRPIGDETINGSDLGLGFTYTTTLQTLSRSLSNAGGQLIKSDQYYDFTGSTYTTSTFELTGADGDNFNRTEYVYDPRGRQARVLDAEGLITRTVYDKLGRATSTWIGTDDTPTDPYELWSPTNNGGDMIQLSAMEYDYNGVGDGNLTRSIQIPGGGLDDRVTDYFYDWRNRTVAVKAGEEATTEDDGVNRAISFTYYNNLNQVIVQLVYDGDEIDIGIVAGVPVDPSDDSDADLLRAKITTDYDDQGRVYKTTQYEVDQADGTIGDTIFNETFHDIRGLTSKIRDANGNETTFEYDGLGRQTKVTTEDPDGSGVGKTLTGIVSYTVYDANGNVEWSILNPSTLDDEDLDENDFATHYLYEDFTDRLWQVIQPDPDGGDPTYSSPVTVYSYDAAGWLYEVSDPLERITRTEYDRLGRTIKTTLPDPTTGEAEGSDIIYLTTYDGVGNVLTTTDALSNVTTYGYNDYHQRTSTTLPDPDGVGGQSAPVSYVSYAPGGEVLTTTDAMNRVTTYEYDLLGRQWQVTSPDPDGVGVKLAARMTYTFDVLGGVLHTEDRLNHVTLSTYDGFHRLETSTNANGEETSFTYDANGNRLTLTDPNNNTTEWEYDALDRVIAETNELNLTREFEYDQDGRLLARIDRLDRKIQYEYDNLNRTLAELWLTFDVGLDEWVGDAQYEWVYDAAGQILEATSAETTFLVPTYELVYDKLGRLQSKTFVYDETGYQKRAYYYYNAVGSLGEVDDYGTGDGWTTNYVLDKTEYILDNLQRQIAMRSGDNSYRPQRANFTYNAAGQLLTIDRHDPYTNGWNAISNATRLVYSEYTYDDAGRIESLTHSDPDFNPFASYGYTWDASDRITAINFLDGTYDDEDIDDLGYDDAGQITSVDRSGSGVLQDEAYDYDDNGNREAVTRDGATDSWGSTTNNQLSTDGVYNYYYDLEGNMSSRVKLDVYGVETDERREFEWDHRNRLTLVLDYNASDVLIQTVGFSYNHENLLTFREVYKNSTLYAHTRYEFNGSQLSVDYGEYHGVNAYGHRIVYGPMTNMALFDVTGPNDSNGVYVLVGDHQNTVRDMVRRNVTSGDFEHINHIQYDSFGNIKDQSYTGSDLVMVIGYTGSYYERYTGMVYNWNRWYDSNAGRWISEDPIGFAGGDVNLGRYVGNASVVYVDPTGLAVPLMTPEQLERGRPPHGTYETKDGGVFEWKIEQRESWEDVSFSATFTPNKDKCPCKNISFVQIAKATLYGRPKYAGDVDLQNTQERYSNSNGFFVDFLYENKDPYYGAKSDGTGGWINESSFDPHWNKPGNGLTGSYAGMTDNPDYLKGEYKVEFETYAVCIDTGEIYVGLSWGFEIHKGINILGHRVFRNFKYIDGRKQDIITTPSKNFIDALRKYNEQAPGDHRTLFPEGGLK